MDLNQLLYHHQVALLEELRSVPANGSRFDLVQHYAKRIREYRRNIGLSRELDMLEEI
ncbi:MAG: hypothetical protein WCY92_12825 [Novosphingobium sp.]